MQRVNSNAKLTTYTTPANLITTVLHNCCGQSPWKTTDTAGETHLHLPRVSELLTI